MNDAQTEIEAPSHYSLSHEAAMLLDRDPDQTNADFAALINEWRANYDFIVIDTPGSFTALSNAAHHQADTLVTPINDSFLDFDVLANVNPQTFEIESLAQYASSVRETRRIRQASGEAILDWIVVRNRLSTIGSRNEKRVDGCLRELSMRLGFRVADGIAERVVFRESFHRGLTALDNTSDNENGVKLSMSNLAARNEVRALINAMRLPIDAQGQKRAETRKIWLGQKRPVVAVPDIFAD